MVASFPDPERFDPERWTAENEANLPRYAYLPFGQDHTSALAITSR